MRIKHLCSWLTVFATASFVFLINSVNNLTAITPYLSTQFHFSAYEIGVLFACYYYANFLFVFWAGIILDRFSPKKVLLISYLIANCSILAFAFTDSMIIMALSRLALGIVGSFSMLNCFQIIKRCFPPQKITLITGIVTTYASLGGLFAQTPLIIAIEKLGFCHGLLLNFWLGLFFCGFALIFAQDLPPNIQQSHGNSNNSNIINIWGSIKITIVNFQNWLIGIYASLATLPSIFFGASWGLLYLQQTQNFSQATSSYILSTGTIGGIIGASLIGWLSDNLQIRKPILIISNILFTTILLVIVYYPQLSLLMYITTFFFLGFISSAQVVIYPLIAANNPSYLVSTATGFVAALTTLNGIYMPALGWLIDSTKRGETAYNFYPLMLTLIAILIISALLSFFIKEIKE